MKDLYDPKDYYQPGKLRLDGEALEKAQTTGIELAATLAAGNTAPLPDTVDDFLIGHAYGINNRQTGEARVAIAELLQTPPFTAEDARQIGKLVGELIVTSQAAATQLSFRDTMGAAIFGISTSDIEPPQHPEAS